MCTLVSVYFFFKVYGAFGHSTLYFKSFDGMHVACLRCLLVVQINVEYV
jgi:hypothetical protein